MIVTSVITKPDGAKEPKLKTARPIVWLNDFCPTWEVPDERRDQVQSKPMS